MHNIQLIRAISAEFVRRKLQSITILVAIVVALLLAGVIYLTTVSVWWWIVAVPIFALSMVVIIVLTVAHVLSRLFKPQVSKGQTKAVSNFVDKLERVAEHIQTPMPFIIFNIARDMVWPRTPTFIQQVVGDSTTLHKDIAQLERDFNAS